MFNLVVYRDRVVSVCFSEGSVSDEQLATHCSSPLATSCPNTFEDFCQSGPSATTEEGLLGRVLFEESSSLDACLGGEGGYGKAPGFEREDQVKHTITLS